MPSGESCNWRTTPHGARRALTSLLDAQMARHELYLCAHLRAAWTDVGSVGVVRRPSLRKSLGFLRFWSTYARTPSAADTYFFLVRLPAADTHPHDTRHTSTPFCA